MCRMTAEARRAELVFRIFRSLWSFEFVSNFEFPISNFLVWLVGALILVPAPASAHLMNTGFGPFYDGLTHLFVTPEDLLPVVALTLLGGLRGPRCARAVLFALPLAWLAGSVAGLLVAPQVTLPAATAAVTIVLGALVAADLPLPLELVAALRDRARAAQRRPQRNRVGQGARERPQRCGSCVRALCGGSAPRRPGGVGARPVGARGDPRGGKLDRGHWLVHAGLVRAWGLRALIAAPPDWRGGGG